MEKLEERELKVIEQFLINRVVAIREYEISSGQKPSTGFKNIFKLKTRSPFSLIVNVDLLNKVRSGLQSGYSSGELSIIHICIHEFLPDIDHTISFSDYTKRLSTPIAGWERMQLIKICRSILRKTGYKKQGSGPAGTD